MVDQILGPNGSIARRLGKRYEHRPEQLDLAVEIGRAVNEGQHLLAEAGTGVGKSFAYLIPAIEYAVKNKKRVIISTHTISLQEQLIQKDIPLIRAVYPDEFTAVLVKGRSNYLCRRRLEQARGRQSLLFEQNEELSSLMAIEQWVAESDAAGGAGEGSLSDFRQVPLPQVWDKVAAEHGNCLGKKCHHYSKCFWQAAKRRMGSGNVLVVNHALFFSDLALRSAGVNYLPKYDVVILDEAHTVEDVAGQHFGIKVSESAVKYNLRSLYDLRRGKGVLTALGPVANDAIASVVDLHEATEQFFDGAVHFHETSGKSNGRLREANIVENTLTPKLRELATKLRGLTTHTEDDEQITELTALSNKVGMMGESLEALVKQTMPDAVYWMDVGAQGSGRPVKRLTWHAAPIDVAEGLRRQLFHKVHSVVMTSATLCTSRGGDGSRDKPPEGSGTRKPAGRGATTNSPGGSASTSSVSAKGQGRSAGDAGVSPAYDAQRRGRFLPHLAPAGRAFAVNFRLADSIPAATAEAWRVERETIVNRARDQQRELTDDEHDLLRFYFSERVEAQLDSGLGECVLRDPRAAEIVQNALKHFDGERYDLLAWCVMPNHVHAVIRSLNQFQLPTILGAWKSFTSHAVNDTLGRSGKLWLDEYYDHLIRDDDDLMNQAEYAEHNARRAGLVDWPWCGKNEEALAEAIGLPTWTDIEGKGKDNSALRAERGRDGHATGMPEARAGGGRDAHATDGSRPAAGESQANKTSPPASFPKNPLTTSPLLDEARKPPSPIPSPFWYIARRLGLSGSTRLRTFEAGSPFDYARQCNLYIERDLPDPADRYFGAAAREKVMKYLQQTNGGAFVLFTAYKPMIEMANHLKPQLDDLGLTLMVQGQGAPRHLLLDQFKKTPNAVLFGTSSFWQGIDVQGDALRNVIIVKLPFSVPDEPLTEAKLEAITRAGGNAFMEYSVPEAIIRLKQGFGRLIRSKTDKGIVVILDSRVATKRYGKLFLDALPPATVHQVTARPSSDDADERDYPQITWD